VDTWLIILIALVGLVVLLSIAALVLANVRARRQLRRERLGEQVGGHRHEADAHRSKASELSSAEDGRRAEAAEQRDLAERHARLAEQHRGRAETINEEADEAAARVSREQELARRHGERADELEENL
jgi:biopolymer transport protein ExbB/TolQ